MHLDKYLFLFSTIVLCASSSQLLDEEWSTWKSKYEKKYTSRDEELFRREAWEASWDKVQKHNQLADQGLKSYRMEVNHFADMTTEERNSRNCLISTRIPSTPISTHKYNYGTNNDIPKQIDWRDSKCVTPAKDQGLCGSCWAFATVGVIESRYCIQTDELLDFSEQQLVDCDHDDSGCCGGLPIAALQYIAHRGVMKTEDYGYEAKQYHCLYDSDGAIKFNKTKFYILPGEDNMAGSVAMDGPISVGFAVNEDFMFYKEGIFDGDCAEGPNHAIIIVGYGTLHCQDAEENGEDYWIIKNSWGTMWGEEGFGKIKRNVNMCDIAAMPATMDFTV
ncbi:cathepsin S-like [Rhinophrynus dorsalis]